MSKFRRFNTKSATLTPDQVYAIRQEYENGATQGELCRKYGVSINTIGRIVRGETWTQFQGPRTEHIHNKPPVSDEEVQASEQRLRAALEPTSQRSEEVLAKLAEAARKAPDSQLSEFLSDKASRYGFHPDSEPPASEAGDKHTTGTGGSNDASHHKGE